ncbi:hypothetical protein V6Z93_005000 [Aspergillus fumigatus]
MTNVADIEAANAQYAAAFTKGHLPLPPKRKLAVVTCMDARIGTLRFPLSRLLTVVLTAQTSSPSSASPKATHTSSATQAAEPAKRSAV